MVVPYVRYMCGRQARGVPVHRLVHYEGSFVLTFPNAYHAGFNTGAPARALCAACWKLSVAALSAHRRCCLCSHGNSATAGSLQTGLLHVPWGHVDASRRAC